MTGTTPLNIPTTVLTGFLGAGKTTYLNQLLHRGIPANSLVLVNDFGKINIDAELIDYQDEHIIRLNNGCVCCTLGGSMAEKLAEIGRLIPAPSALYIETSGVANALRVADMVRVSTRFILKDVWCFVNVSLAQQHSNDGRVNVVWEQQIKSATQLLLNRLANTQDIPVVLQKLLQQSSAKVHYDFTSTIREASNSHLSDNVSSQNISTLSSEGDWHSFSFVTEEKVDIDELKKVMTQAATTLYRAKGLLASAPSRKTLVLQYTGGQWNLTPTAKTVHKTQLVFIGEAQGMAKLKQQLQLLWPAK